MQATPGCTGRLTLSQVPGAPDRDRSKMKVFLLPLFGSLLCHTEAMAGIAEIPETNQVILADGDWKPSAEETRKALAAIQSFLEGPGFTNDLSKSQMKIILEHDKGYLDWMEKRIRKIREHAKEYRVQFLGKVSEGERVIWCNFFPLPRDGKKDEFEDWQEHWVSVKDGGFRYWNIKYDPGSGQCRRLCINAEP